MFQPFLLMKAFRVALALGAGCIFISAPALPSLAQKAAPILRSISINNLPHRTLPEGQFLRWCGQDGSVLMAKRERPSNLSLWIQGRSDKEINQLPTTKGLFECDSTGKNLLINESSSVKGTITRFDVMSRATSIIVTYSTNQFAGGHGISISPDQTSVAFDTDLSRVAADEQSSHLKLVSVANSRASRTKDSLIWSADSSFVLNATVVSEDAKDQKLHQEAVQLTNVRSGKEIAGNLPSGNWFESGVVLEGGSKLLLFLRPSQNDVAPDPGTVFACATEPKLLCRAIISAVDEVSFSNEGKIALVREVMKDPKKRTDGDSIVLPIAYIAEIHASDGSLLAEQRYIREKTQLGLRLPISPGGDEVALVWQKWSDATREFDQSSSIVSLDVGK